MKTKNTTEKTTLNLHHDLLVCLLLLTTTFSVYWQVKDHEFVNYDDGKYITANNYVQDGLNVRSIAWSFTSTRASNWHPLTWLSLLLGCQLHGMDAGWHHLTNVVFHIANTLLLFLVFRKMTGGLWRSGFVAALFALHPLHVESVAWIAERKDVLSTFFWMLTMCGYIRYVDRPSIAKYLSVLLFFSLGLLSKPMLVTLPFVLLLLDYWPLGRFQAEQSIDKSKQMLSSLPLRLVWEKIPFFVLAAASSIVTFLVQQRGEAVASLYVFSLNVRIGNALVSYVRYLGKMIWPCNLSVFYPHLEILSWWQVAGAFLLLAAISLLALRTLKRSPYVAVGWLWYVGSLVPVIGLVQVGEQSMADRYTYVPLIGVFIIIAWGIPDLVCKWRYRKIVCALTPAPLLLILIVLTWIQIGYWTNSTALWKRALDVTDNNYVAHNNLGVFLASQGKTSEAISHYKEALRINLYYAEAQYNLGFAMESQGRTSEAISHYKEALRLKPDYAEAQYNLGLALERQGKISEAITHFQEALRIKPDFVEAHNNLGVFLESQGRISEAISHYKEALRIKPDYVKAHYNLGFAMESQDRISEAISHYKKALRINPDYVMAHSTLGAVLARNGKTAEAIIHIKEVLRIRPGYVKARSDLKKLLELQIKTQRQISRTGPD